MQVRLSHERESNDIMSPERIYRDLMSHQVTRPRIF